MSNNEVDEKKNKEDTNITANKNYPAQHEKDINTIDIYRINQASNLPDVISYFSISK
jgi:hypothetical protein